MDNNENRKYVFPLIYDEDLNKKEVKNDIEPESESVVKKAFSDRTERQDVESKIQDNKKYTSTEFVSPVFGRVKNKSTYPTSNNGNTSKKYDFLRDKSKMSEESLIKKYGTKYYEFTNILGRKRDTEKSIKNKSSKNNVDAKKDIQLNDKFVISSKKQIKEEDENESQLEIPFAGLFENQKTVDEEVETIEGIIYEEEIELDSLEDDGETSFNENNGVSHFFEPNKKIESDYEFKNNIPKKYIQKNDNDINQVSIEFEDSFNINDDQEEIVNNMYEDNFEDISSMEQVPIYKKQDKEREEAIKQVAKAEIEKREKERKADSYESYNFPKLSLLHDPDHEEEDCTEWIQENVEKLNCTFSNFGIQAHVINYTQGPTVTRFEVQPGLGVKVNRITNLQNDIKLNLAATDIRIEAPIPGKSSIGIEVPNKNKKIVRMRNLLDTEEYMLERSLLKVALGLDIAGKPIFTNIDKMPHGLIAGATGSGKSVCINAIICSILFNARPDEVKLMLIDPKMVELAPYKNIPHLVTPVINDSKTATSALKWATEEMDRRYEQFVEIGAKDIRSFNLKCEQLDNVYNKLPYIIIIIDELADLMSVAAQEVEDYILRIAQKARAAGIHLLLATQRPSVNIITGTIKTNIPTRIAFAVQSGIDSRTILDEIGAEELLGRGDMLFYGSDMSRPSRVQGVFISEDEIYRITDFIKSQAKPSYMFELSELFTSYDGYMDYQDELYDDIVRHVIRNESASASSIQRHFRVGYNRAARLIDMLEYNGIVGPSQGSKPRDVLITLDEYEKS